MTTIQTIVRAMRVFLGAGTLLFGLVVTVVAQTPEPAGMKSPAVAKNISVAATVAPALISLASGGGGVGLLAGLLFGPTAGYVYAGQGKEAIAPAFVRVAVVGAAVGGAAAICAVGDCGLGLFGGESGSALAPAAGVLLGGFVATIILASRDISRVDDRVRARNDELMGVSVQPAFFPDARAVGIAVTWR